MPHLTISISSANGCIAFIQQENNAATINVFQTKQSLSGSITLSEGILKCKRAHSNELNSKIVDALGTITGLLGDHFDFGNVSKNQVEKLITSWKEQYNPCNQSELIVPIDGHVMTFNDENTFTF